MATLRQALEYASRNPSSEFAKFLTMRVQSGEADEEARQSGIDLTPIKKLAPQPPAEEPGYFSRVGTELATTGKEALADVQKLGEESLGQFQQGGSFKNLLGGTASALRAGLRTAGATARSIFTPIVEAPIIKPALEKIGEAATKIPGAETALGKLSEWSQKHPDAAKDLENFIDITALTGLPAISKPAGAVTGEIATKAGRVIEESGLKAAQIAKESLAKELVMPLRTSAVKTAQVARTTEKGTGIFKRSVIEPTFFEKRAIEEVAKIPEIKAGNTLQQNYNIIKGVNRSKAEELISLVEQNNVPIPRKETISKLSSAASHLTEHPLIVGDAQKTAERLIEGAKKFVNQNSGDAKGILKARKEFDEWVLNQKPKAFDAPSENAFTIANREIREVMNKMLDDKLTDVPTRELRHQQSALFDAMENIAPKAAKEADTAIGRAMDRASAVLGTKNKAVQAVAAAVGIGGLGAAATFAPAAAVLGGAGFMTYKGGQLLLKPEVRIAIGKLLQESGKLLNPEDRKILENALETYREIPNKEGGFINPKKIAEDISGKSEKSLFQEARKYKSAEEFAKSQKPVYHGTTKTFEKFDPELSPGGSAWFTDSRKAIETGADLGLNRKAGETVKIMDRYIKPGLKLVDRGTSEGKKLADDLMTGQLESQGYRGIIHEADKVRGRYVELFYPNEDALTKSQLTDIWKKAHGINP